MSKPSRRVVSTPLVQRQTAELIVELASDKGLAKRFITSLRGFDAYVESIEKGATRNHFKLSIHSSGESHHYGGGRRYPSAQGQALGSLVGPLALDRRSIGGANERLIWRGKASEENETRRVLVVDTRLHIANWVVVLAVPSYLSGRIDGWLHPEGYLGNLVSYVVSDWTEPHIVVAVYCATPEILDELRSKMALEQQKHFVDDIVMVGPSLAGIPGWGTVDLPPTPGGPRWRRLR